MSVIVAVKENGVIYMGADSQTSVGNHRLTHLNQIGFKVNKLDNGILVGFCGRVAAKHAILANKDVFVLDENGNLTKKHIVNKIIPKLVDKIKEIGDEESGSLDVTILIAYKDSLYSIKDKMDVIKINEVVAIGAGNIYTKYVLCKQQNLPVKQRILKALVESAKYCDSVSGPFVLIDTNFLEYEIVDLKGENHWLLP